MTEHDAGRTAAGHAALGDLLAASHLSGPDRVLELAREAAARFGAGGVAILLVDFEQRLLTPVDGGEPVPVDGSLPGRVYTSGEAFEATEGDGVRLVLPLRDGTDRLGVFAITLPSADAGMRQSAEDLNALVGQLVVSKDHYGDRFFRARRRKDMKLAAHLQWQLLPPLTFATPEVAVAAALEPAYEVGGDVFDYASNDGTFHLVVFDAMGHGVEASLIATIAVTTYRAGRRDGLSLSERLAAVDAAITERFGPDRFATAVAADLDVATGMLRWLDAGHPRPLLIRNGKVVGALACQPGPPLGLEMGLGEVATERLEPGDLLLFFTDGMVEARSGKGEAFGFERLADFVTRQVLAGHTPAETMRRLTHALLDYHGGSLQDDATAVLVAWRPPL